VFCTVCSAALPPDAGFCSNCGAAIVPAALASAERLRPPMNPWRRVQAFGLDQFFLFLLVPLGFFLFYQLSFAAGLVVASVIPWLYYAGFESAASWQASPGKSLYGLKIVRTNGQKLSFLRASVRYFARVLSLGLWIGAAISFFLIAFTEEQQALHDKLVDAQVVTR
jgi:uncharacterized RDD family membrane protein YckC